MLHLSSLITKYNVEDGNYPVQSNPIPGAAWEVGRHFEFGCGISNAIPLILHYECDQGNIHLIWELQKTFSINIYTEQKYCKNNVNLNDEGWILFE